MYIAHLYFFLLFSSWRHDDNTCCLRAKEGASHTIHYSIQTRRTDDTKRDRACVDSYVAAAVDFTSLVDDNQSRIFIDTAQSTRFLSPSASDLFHVPCESFTLQKYMPSSAGRRRRRRFFQCISQFPLHLLLRHVARFLLPVVW